MLVPNLRPKVVVPHHGSRLLLGLTLYVLVDDWWRERHPPPAGRKPGRPALLSESEVLTLAILAQWSRFRSERDFWRFASSHLRSPTSQPPAPKASSTGGCAPWSRNYERSKAT
jgi:hypothetical protein